jgi:uncharacterized SAM-binding protein YcdF (DUF218 family)
MNRSTRTPMRPLRQRTSGGIFGRLLGVLVVLAALFVLYLLREPLLRMVGGIWVVEEAPFAADAILLLGDDNYPAQRAAQAAELFHERRAPLIVASGRYLRPYVSVPDLMQRDLTDRGVPSAAILRMASFVSNTREEAVVLRKLVEARKWKKVLVVTSNYHTRRTHYLFERVFRGATEFRVIAARDSEYDPDEWWRSRSGWKRFLYETAGFTVAVWETRNEKASLEIDPRKLDVSPSPAAR